MKQKGVLIGCGHISERQLWAWQQIETVEIAAVCDLDVGRARERAAQFDIPAVYTDYRRMLDAVQPDFVDIATRPASHLELVGAAAARGLAVLCQKPLANTLADCRRIVDICREAGVLLMVNENARHQPWFRQARAILDSGALGEPFYARFETRQRWSLPEPNFGGQPYFESMPQLMVYEMGVHFLDTARYLFGEAKSLYARLRRVSPHIAGEEVALLMVDFGRLTCLIDCSWASLSPPQAEVTWGTFRIEGSAGSLDLTSDGRLTLYTDGGEQYWTFPEDGRRLAFVATQQHFIDCLTEGTTPETDGPETLKTMALVFGAYRSAAEGTAIKPEA